MLPAQEEVTIDHDVTRGPRAIRGEWASAIKPGALAFGSIVIGFVAATAGCCAPPIPPTPPISAIPTVEMHTEPFGHSTKAEVYPLQYNSAHGDGQMVPRVNSSEVMYVVPRPLVAVSDVVRVDVAPATDPALRRVAVTIAPAARARVQALTASKSPTHIVVLVWRNEIYDDYPAQWFDSAGPIIIGDLLEPAIADALAVALTP